MKTLVKGFTALVGAFALATAGNVVLADVQSDATINFVRPDLSNARIVEDMSALDLNFGEQLINQQLHWNGQTFWEQNGGRHITIEDLTPNGAGWTLRVGKTPFTNAHTGHQLSTELGFQSSWLESTTHNIDWWGSMWLSPWSGSTTFLGGGYGVHTLRWHDVSLHVWSGQNIQEGAYQSTLTWSIELSPNGEDNSIGGENDWAWDDERWEDMD